MRRILPRGIPMQTITNKTKNGAKSSVNELIDHFCKRLKDQSITFREYLKSIIQDSIMDVEKFELDKPSDQELYFVGSFGIELFKWKYELTDDDIKILKSINFSLMIRKKLLTFLLKNVFLLRRILVLML